jgi:hypothetical protein
MMRALLPSGRTGEVRPVRSLLTLALARGRAIGLATIQHSDRAGVASLRFGTNAMLPLDPSWRSL